MADNVKLYKYSSSPHVKAPKSTKFIMINVCIALLPACVMGIIYFGGMAALILALALVSAVASEFVYLLICGKTFKEIAKQFDFTSCVTGLLIGMSIGTNYPWYAPVLGSVFAIIVVKMLFGGTGKNLVNPAVTGRIFIFMSFQTVVGKWVDPSGNLVTGATTLAGIFENGTLPMYIESYALAGNFRAAEKYGAMNCIECGSCAYNCPAKRSLVQSISYAKAKIKEMKQNGR